MTPSLKDMTTLSFGPHLYGARLHVDEDGFTTNGAFAVDVETDEKDNFVGLAVCNSPTDVWYYTKMDSVKDWLSKYPVIGHNVKFDLKLLKKWGADITSKSLLFDTCLASYVVNTTRESHSLKDIARDLLGLSWPTYREMVGMGRKKVTLDKQAVERVAAYCGMDCLATYKLYEYFAKEMTPHERHLLDTIELPIARVLMEIELKGVQIDLHHLKALDATLSLRMERIKDELAKQWKREEKFNINSNRQVAQLLEEQGAELPKTPKGSKKVDKLTLQQLTKIPAVPLLLEYSKIEKLWSTYTQGLLKRQQNGRIYCTFNQITRSEKGTEVGIHTGRLSSSDPNLQNIPVRTEDGKMIMKGFIPDDGCVLVNADYSQIEPRLLAHFSKDPFLLDVYRNDRDLYTELVKGTGRSRQDGKTFMLALLYGAQPKKLANVFNCTEIEAKQILEKMWAKLPGVRSWINQVKWNVKNKKGVSTLHGRWIPLPLISSKNIYERFHWERVAVNSIIQGSAAEVMKLALIELKKHKYTPNLTVHDSVVINISKSNDENECFEAEHIKAIMESVVDVDVPLKVDVNVGGNWSDAKGD